MYSINGIGTKLYGRAMKNQDGSYVATKWIIFLLLPIIPLSSYRVTRGKTESSISPFPIFGEKTNYTMKKISLNWSQVGKTYLVSWGPVLLTLLFIVWYLSTYYS